MVKKLSKFLLVASFLTILVLPAKTYAVSWFPIVPCGLNQQPKDSSGTEIPKSVHDYTQPCNQCLLVELGKNIIDMTFYAIVPSVGTLLFMIAGFIILFNARNGNAAGVESGKKIMTNTAIGIAIILGSWLITNFILKSIANEQVAGTPWYKIDCRVGNLKDLTDVTLPSVGGGGDGGDGTGGTGGGTGTGTGAQCGDMNAVCNASSCKPFINDPALPSGKTDWTYLIPEVVKDHQIDGVNTAKFLEAIIRIESQGKVARQSNSSPPSCGLTQMQAGTANMFRRDCGITHEVTCDWLQGKNLQAGETVETVAKASICMAAEYAKSIKGGRCYGGQVRDLAAGYNGGGGCNASLDRDNALALSRTCNSSSTATNKYETDCNGRTTLRYECVYNDLAHTTCNTGFKETRNYVQQFNACYQ